MLKLLIAAGILLAAIGSPVLAQQPSTTSPFVLGWSPGIDPGGDVMAVNVPVLTVTGISGINSVALAGSGDTISVFAQPGGVACGAPGSQLLASGFDANAPAGTTQNLTVQNPAVPAGDWLCLVSTGLDWTLPGASGKGAVTVYAMAGLSGGPPTPGNCTASGSSIGSASPGNCTQITDALGAVFTISRGKILRNNVVDPRTNIVQLVKYCAAAPFPIYQQNTVLNWYAWINEPVWPGTWITVSRPGC